jgi:hypothetical protein
VGGQPPLTKKGDRIRLYSAKWDGEYTDADGVEQCVPLSTDKTAAGLMLAELVRKAELGKADVRDPFEEHHKRPLAEHLEDYHRHLLAKGNTQEHADKTRSRIQAIVDGCGFVRIKDLSAEAVEEFLRSLRQPAHRARAGRLHQEPPRGHSTPAA